jgi:hypothetical protein
MKLFIGLSAMLGFVLLVGGNQFGILGFIPLAVDGLINLLTEEIAD